MNKAILIGRLTREPESTTSSSGKSISRFTLAVDRPVRRDSPDKQADFIPVTAFGVTADFVAKYMHKGSACAVCGSIRTGSYDAQDGTKRYTTEIWADNVEFVPRTYEDGQASGGTATATQTKRPKIDELEVINDDTDVPF